MSSHASWPSSDKGCAPFGQYFASKYVRKPPSPALHYDVPVLPSVRQFIRKHRLISPGDRVGVAVSAGADSVALLRVLLELRHELGCILSVVHLHHQLRAAEADADAAFVQQLAVAHSLEFHSTRADVATIASDHKLSIEAAGRRARLDYFAALVASNKLDLVATAHSADDQAETVLLKFLRGAGTRGLAGIYPVSQQRTASGDSVTLIRPLLDVTRPEIETYLRALHQPWREDATNQSPEFLRNRVRHELLPLLAREYNPSIREALATSANIAREEQDFWDVTTSNVLPDLRTDTQNIDVSRFLTMHMALQRRVLKALAPRELDFAHIELAREFILAAQAGERELARGVTLRLQRSTAGEHSFKFVVAPSPEPSSPADYTFELPIPGEITLPARNSRLVARLVEHAPYGSALDVSLTGHSLTIRNWRAGDRFQPLGRGVGKVKDFFQQLHVPANARSTWPVAELDGEIVWVLSLPVSARFATKSSPALVIEEFSIRP